MTKQEPGSLRIAMMILLSASALISGIAMMEIGERTLTAGVFALLLLVIVVLSRRFRRAADQVPLVFKVAAAISVTLGVLTLITGVLHSAAVTALALGEPDWAPLTILRFTTGAMLMYSGAMSLGMGRAIRAGRQWAVRVSAATSALFCLYLMLLFPLPGTGGTVPPMLGLWSAYLLWLCAAVVATVPRDTASMRVEQQPAC
jgi:hypothetical protein